MLDAKKAIVPDSIFLRRCRRLTESSTVFTFLILLQLLDDYFKMFQAEVNQAFLFEGSLNGLF